MFKNSIILITGGTGSWGRELTKRLLALRPKEIRIFSFEGGMCLVRRGSVVPFFLDMIKQQQVFPITSVLMTRFLLTVSDAIELLVKAVTEAVGGEIYVMKLNACRITDLAVALQEKHGVPHLGIKEVGIRPGEKLHEELVSPYESDSAYRLEK